MKIAQSTVAIIASHAEISFQKFLKMLTTMAVEIIINYKPPPLMLRGLWYSFSTIYDFMKT